MNAEPSAPGSPFKGLAAFEDSELDALFFFGRERERTVLVANLLAARLTVLYGESGVGKSSLLGAGVMRELRALEPGSVVAMRDTWSGSAEDVLAEVRGSGEAYLILDQFEEYFLYNGEDGSPGALLQSLPELLEGSRVNVLVSLREDSLARLDAFKARIPGIFGNQVRLEHLDRDAARSAILGPVARWNELTGDRVEIEPELVEAVLDDVSVGRGVEAPYLQLVLERIWFAERDEGSTVLRVATLRRLGGAATIVRDHLHGALEKLEPGQQDVAASMFEHLVTPSGTKIAHRAPDLAEYADVPEGALRTVLESLTRARIVHSVDGSDRYEIFHDVLAEPIRAWRLQRRLENDQAAARRRQRRLYIVSAASLVALAIVAGLAVWALSERGSARSQARHARAREFEATALQQLAEDPNRSVRLSLAAVRLEPSRAAESVLRQALSVDRLQLVLGVGGPVGAVAISPRGDMIAAGAPGRVLLADSRRRRVRWRGSVRGAIAELAFSPDGRQLVAASPGGAARAWDARTGRPVPISGRFVVAPGPHGRLITFPSRGRLARERSHIQFLRITRRFAAAAVGEPGGRVQAWLFDRDGRRLRVLPQIGVHVLAFSPDGSLLATGSADGTTMVWNLRTGRRTQVLGSKKGVTAVGFSPDGKLLATGSKDSTVTIWDVATGTRTYFLFAHTNPVTALAWSPDGRVVASASLDRTVRLWRVRTEVGSGSLAATLVGAKDAIESLAFSADSTRLVTGSDDGTTRVWDARPDAELRVLGRAPTPFVGAKWAGTRIVAASTDGTVQVFDAKARKRTGVLEARKALLSYGASADGSVVVAGFGDGSTEAWNGSAHAASQVFRDPAPVLAVAVSPNGELAASGDSLGDVRLWDAASGRVLWSGAYSGAVNDLAFSARGDRLAGAGPDGVLLWSTPRARARLLPVPGGVLRLAFSPDGRYVGAACVDGTVRLWFARTGGRFRVMHGHRAPVTDLAFSPDGKLVATSSEDSDGRIWSVATGTSLHVLRGHFGSVTSIAFSPNSRWLVTAGPISAAIWPRSTGILLGFLRGDTDLLTSVAFSPDGHVILSASRDGTVRTYRCDVCVSLEGLVRLAEVRLARTR
jgi:WD40 repeat protein